MVNRSIIPPVKENNISYRRGITGVPEPAFTFKPFHTVRTKREFWNSSTLDITTLVCTPWHKAGTPLYPASKSIPSPISRSAFSFLRCCHLNDCLIADTCRDSSKCIILKHMRYILLVPITVPPHSLCHHIGKFRCIRKGISTSGFRPFQISISIIVALQCQFNIFHIQRIFYSCTFQTAFYFLHTTRNRILWICDSIWLSGIFCIKAPFWTLHRVKSSPAWFLHHNGFD